MPKKVGLEKKKKLSNQASSINHEDNIEFNLSKDLENDGIESEKQSDCSNSEDSDRQPDKTTYDRVDPITFDVIELDEALKILNVTKSISDLALMDVLGALKMGKNLETKMHNSSIAGAMLTVILNRPNWETYRLFYDKIVCIELVAYLDHLNLPNGVTLNQLAEHVTGPQVFRTKVKSIELAYEILGLKSNATPDQILDSITTLPENDEWGKFEFMIASGFRIASSPKHSKVLRGIAIGSIVGEFNRSVKGIEFCDDVSKSVDEAMDTFFGKLKVMATRLAQFEVSLSLSHGVINDLKKKLAATSTSKTPLIKVQLEHSKKREELLQEENVELKERVSYCEDRIKTLAQELDQEKQEKLDLSRTVEGLKKEEEKFLFFSKSKFEPQAIQENARSSESDAPLTKSDKSIDSNTESNDSRFVIERLLSQLKEANDKLSEKTNENIELLLALSETN